MKQLPWTLCAVALALVAWLALAVVNVENQRNALASKACAEADAQCLAAAQSRAALVAAPGVCDDACAACKVHQSPLRAGFFFTVRRYGG